MRATRSAAIVTATSVRSPEEASDRAAVAASSSAVGRSTSARSASGSALSAATVWPAKVTARAATVRPLPPQSEQGPDSTKRSARARCVSLPESARVCSMKPFALQNRPLYGFATRSRCGVTSTTGCSAVNSSQSRSAWGSSRQGRSMS
jgi:hypothetical protein